MMQYHTVCLFMFISVSPRSASSPIDSDLIHLKADDRHDECSLKIKSNQTGHCECTSLMDIRCQNLSRIPRFDADDQVYSGIYMADQAITEIPPAALEGLKVRKIVLNFNAIEDRLRARAWSGLEQWLQELYMGDCRLKSLPEGMLDEMIELRCLHLWNNQITVIPPGFFKGCRNLRELLLWGNRIERIDQHSFAGLWNLRKLDLDRNKISVLTKDAFQHLSGLEVIHLGENRIGEINSETFQYAHSLKVLNLDRNGLGHVFAKSFHGISELLSLDLQNNNLSNLTVGPFANLSKLKTLMLQHNSLKTIRGQTFTGLQSLTYLDLSNNRLEKMPDAALSNNRKLRHIFIDDNQLKTLNNCVLVRRYLRTLSILGNPINCDCKLAWLIDLREKRGVSVWGTCSQSRMVTSPTSVVNRFPYKAASCKFESYECKQ